MYSCTSPKWRWFFVGTHTLGHDFAHFQSYKGTQFTFFLIQSMSHFSDQVSTFGCRDLRMRGVQRFLYIAPHLFCLHHHCKCIIQLLNCSLRVNVVQWKYRLDFANGLVGCGVDGCDDWPFARPWTVVHTRVYLAWQIKRGKQCGDIDLACLGEEGTTCNLLHF